MVLILSFDNLEAEILAFKVKVRFFPDTLQIESEEDERVDDEDVEDGDTVPDPVDSGGLEINLGDNKIISTEAEIMNDIIGLNGKIYHVMNLYHDFFFLSMCCWSNCHSQIEVKIKIYLLFKASRFMSEAFYLDQKE